MSMHRSSYQSHGDVNRLSRINVHSSYTDQIESLHSDHSTSGRTGRLSEYSALLDHYRYWGLNNDAYDVADADIQQKILEAKKSSVTYTYTYTILFIIGILLIIIGGISYQRRSAALSVVLPPVIIIPDIFCSKLEFIVNSTNIHHESIHPDLSTCTKSSHHTYTNIYNTSLLHPPVSSCLVAALTMVYDKLTNTFHNQPTVSIRTSQFGSINSIVQTNPLYTPIQTQYSIHDDDSQSYMSSFYSYYYDSQSVSDSTTSTAYIPCQYTRLIKSLLSLGYIPGETLFAAPYDWRRAAPDLHKSQFIEPLQQLIEYAVTTNNRRVRLLSHGAGTDYTLYFTQHMTDKWLHKHIKHMVALDGDMAGNREYSLPIVTGLAIQAQRVLPLPPEQMISIWQSMTYLIWKLPVYIHTPLQDTPVVDTPSKFYTTSNRYDMSEMLARVGANDLSLTLKNYSHHQQYSIPRINIHVILPTHVPILETYVFVDDDLLTLPSVMYTLNDNRSALHQLVNTWQNKLNSSTNHNNIHINVTSVIGATRQLLPASSVAFDVIERLIDSSHHRHRITDHQRMKKSAH